MPVSCTTCDHPERAAIDAALVAGERSVRGIARQYGLDRTSLSRHRDVHLSPALAQVVAEEAKAGPRTALARLEELYDRLERQAEAAETQGAARLLLMTSRELRQTLETLARMTGELDDRPQVAVLNLSTNPEWTLIRTALMRALAPWPDARAAAARALDRPDAGDQVGSSPALPAPSGDAA